MTCAKVMHTVCGFAVYECCASVTGIQDCLCESTSTVDKDKGVGGGGTCTSWCENRKTVSVELSVCVLKLKSCAHTGFVGSGQLIRLAVCYCHFIIRFRIH